LAPMVGPALAVVAGAAWVHSGVVLPVGPLVALLALCIATRRGWGLLLAGVVVGCLLAQLEDSAARGAGVTSVAPGQVVTLSARVRDHWRRDDSGWRAPVAIDRLLRRHQLAPGPAEALLTLPGSAEPPAYGSRVRLRATLARGSGYANGGVSRPTRWRIYLPSRKLLQVEGAGSWLHRASTFLRGRAEGVLDVATERPGLGLARALLLGDSSQIDEATLLGLRRSGLAHLLAVSGLHIGLVAGLALFFGRWLPLSALWRRRLAVALAAALIGLYLLLVGPRPSALRAALMGCIALAALVGERRGSSLNHWAWAMLTLVLLKPSVVGDLGFRLTLSATAGIVILAPRFVARWQGLPGWLARPLAVSVAAQLSVLPWTVPAFGQLSPLAPLFNLLAVPWMALALAGSGCWMMVAAWSPKAGLALLPALDVLAAPFAWPTMLELPRLSLGLSMPLSGSLALACLGFVVVWWPRRALILGVVAGLIVVAGLGIRSLVQAPEERSLELVMIDVGQGDAILLRDGSEAVLVDGGGWRRGNLGLHVLLPALRELGIGHLRAVVLTHPDLDHCGGLVDLVALMPVDEIWSAPGWPLSGCAGQLYRLGRTRQRPLWTGETVAFGRWSFLVLNPPPRRGEFADGARAGGTRPVRRRAPVSDNDRSLVLLASTVGRTVLLTGDISAMTERQVVARIPPNVVRLDVLKVAHHGSRSSTSRRFLDRLRPRLGLISAGVDNRYHHPSSTVLGRLRQHRVQVLRTDRQGRITVTFDDAGAMTARWVGR